MCSLAFAAVVAGAEGCAARRAQAAARVPAPEVALRTTSDSATADPANSVNSVVVCRACTTLAMPPDLAVAIEARVADLKARGGDCAAYGAVLEDALEGGHITIKPYMWRVRGNLASAEGESSGGMILARDIDSLNVGVRALDDVLHSAEHEAAHIAMKIASGDEAREARVEERVAECRAPVRR
jgi:hypothetical protein